MFLDSRGSKGEADVKKNALVSSECANPRFMAEANDDSDAPSARVFQGHPDNDHEQEHDF